MGLGWISTLSKGGLRSQQGVKHSFNVGILPAAVGSSHLRSREGCENEGIEGSAGESQHHAMSHISHRGSVRARAYGSRVGVGAKSQRS